MERIPIHLNPTFPYTGVTTEANTVRIYIINTNQRISAEVKFTMMEEIISMLSISNAKLILLILNLAYITPNADGAENQEPASEDLLKAPSLLALEALSCTLHLDLSGTLLEPATSTSDHLIIEDYHKFSLIDHLIILMMLLSISHTIKE
jgi:hypothetical protein